MTRRLFLTLSATATAAAVATALVVYLNREQWLPADVPTHWNIHDEVDQTTPRDRVLPVLFILPGVMVGWVVLALVLPWLSPKPFAVDEFRGTYHYIMFLVVLLFGWMHATMLATFVWPALGALPIRLMVAGAFLFIALLGNLLGKVRRNFWIGVRTPWTLANETVWNQTHRLAAWTFTAGGVIACVAMLIHPLTGVVVGVVGLLAAALTPAVYSLVLYKRLERQGKL